MYNCEGLPKRDIYPFDTNAIAVTLNIDASIDLSLPVDTPSNGDHQQGGAISVVNSDTHARTHTKQQRCYRFHHPRHLFFAPR